MIHVVDASNISEYASEIEAVWRLRHQVFVEEMGWRDLDRPDGREIDQFDTPATVHLLAIDNGQVIGYSRLVPTLGPHLMSEVFPYACEGEVPRGPQIWEWTRQAVATSHRARGTSRLVTVRLLAGIVEWGMAHGVTSVTTLMPMSYLGPFLDAHFRVVPLGLPLEIDGKRTLAGQAHFDARTLRRLGEMRDDTTPVLVNRSVAARVA
jgi:acyl-homoserine lactone synthase